MPFNVLDSVGATVAINSRTVSSAEVTKHDIESITAGASADIGAVADAAVITDANGSLSGKLRGIVKILAERFPGSLGQKTKANSLAVTLASDSDGIQIIAGSQSMGGVKDNGPFWTPIQLAGSSADASSSALNITNAPGGGLSIVVDDLIVTVATDLVLTVKEVSGADLFVFHAKAAAPFHLKMRNGLRGSTNKQIAIQTSASGQIYTFASWHEV